MTTGITFGLANLISVTAKVGTTYASTPGKTIGIYAALLISHGVTNTFGVKILRILNNTSIILHSIGIGCFAIAVLAKAPTHQSAKFVFAKFYDGTGDAAGGPGWSIRASPAYVAVCGVLMSQYTITGYGASNLLLPRVSLMTAFAATMPLPIYPKKQKTPLGAHHLEF